MSARPAEDADDMEAVLIDKHRDALMLQNIDTPTDEFTALWREIGDVGREFRVTRNPRLYGMLIGGHDINRMGGQQRIHVGTYQLVTRQPA